MATTVEEQAAGRTALTKPTPGVLLFLADQHPHYELFQVGQSGLRLGRGTAATVLVSDPLLSREHVEIRLEDGTFVVIDLESRNGTFAQGKRVHGELCVVPPGVVRVGGSLLLLSSDVRGFALESVSVQRGMVIGPDLRAVLKAVARAAAVGRTLLVTGESGTGKELVARAFHDQTPNAAGPFVTVNCAAIPEGVAERLLFGARRGAFSGATDAAGYAQHANGGTLFLDEVAELDPNVQTKLLRLIESGDVQRLGAERSETVDVHVCAATWRDLRTQVAVGRFREDLYYRLGRPDVRLPPLRERLYEIPWHAADELERLGSGVQQSAAFVEACALRPWPGNIRELRAEIRRAAGAAAEAGRVVLSAEDLDPAAGTPLAAPIAANEPEREPELPDDETARALREERGNVARAARRLGVHRNRVRRWLERHGIDPKIFRGKPTR